MKISLDTKIYPLEAIYGASYVFIDRAYIFLDSAVKNKIIVFIKVKNNITATELEKIKGEFLNELLNYSLRLNLSRENKRIREYIVKQALFAAANVEDDQLQGYEDDPLGIAIPWEEKYGKTEEKVTVKKSKKK